MTSSTLQLEFRQAMSDFKTMFPDMDDDVIEAVLRANQGVVDATIDQLLAMSTDNQNEKLRNQIEEIESSSSNAPRVKNKTLKAPTMHKRWNPPLLGPLPPTFLRIMPHTDADVEDERLAALLQNEEFVAQLRWNEEFMSTLEREQGGAGRTQNDDDFKEKLKNMGKLSRKKLSQLSRLLTTSGRKLPSPARCNSTSNTVRLRDDHSDDE